jgi:hypothetical protein
VAAHMERRGVFEPGEDRLIRQGVVPGERALGSRQGVRRHDRWRITMSQARFEVPGDCPRLSIIRRVLVRRRAIGARPVWRRPTATLEAVAGREDAPPPITIGEVDRWDFPPV